MRHQSGDGRDLDGNESSVPEMGRAMPFGSLPAGGPGVEGPEESRKRRISGRQRWYAGALVGLTYLVIAMVQAAGEIDSVGEVVAFEALALLFAAAYMFGPVLAAHGSAFAGQDSDAAGKVGVVLGMLAVSVPMVALGGVGVSGLWIYIGVISAILFRTPIAVAIAVVLAVGMLITWSAAGEGLPWELAVTLVALTLWMAGFASNIRLTIELRQTRDELARSAVAAERARIGRDLHDILGHSLTAIAVKAGLAGRMIDRDAHKASGEVADIERLARGALADVRATVAGYRDVSLATEIAVARSVLEAAGIEPALPTAVDDVSDAGRNVFGYVVREAVTNVVRHSDATRCTVELSRDEVVIRDNGAPRRADRDGAAGAGLLGLAERVQAAGGTFSAYPGSGGGFEVRATVSPQAAAGRRTS